MQISREPTVERRPSTTRPFGRSRNNRIIAGVAAGLADRRGIDPVVIRLSFVV
ncbi:MAG: PspC domain, partial [Actinomycetota bacterium]|nr:PspC domain [Actinomycetota bacterium]